MKVRYVLIFDGQRIESGSEKELRRISANTDCYWELWKYVIPTTKFSDGNLKLTILDMREILSMHEDEIDVKYIAKQFNITTAWTQKVIKQMRMEKLKKITLIK